MYKTYQIERIAKKAPIVISPSSSTTNYIAMKFSNLKTHLDIESIYSIEEITLFLWYAFFYNLVFSNNKEVQAK